MNNNNNNELLPEGFKVLLPYNAEKEEFLSREILDILNKNGYKKQKINNNDTSRISSKFPKMFR